MIEGLKTVAEQRALEAEDLPAFNGLKLLQLKRELATVLGLIGRGEIFDQYTLHDVTHIDAMLSMLDWLIPPKTAGTMTPADWLLVVLAIYFHDFGLLVTRDEYEERTRSGFPRFRDEHLFGGSEGQDYRAKIVETYPDANARERFLYQEYVRHNHASRIGAWINGQVPSRLGVAQAAAAAIQSWLGDLDARFRRDLALVCESHHLDDVGNTRKYRTSQPYGNSPRETANMQFAAVILRTADLLHITKDRTPSIAYRFINPSDPISQREWAKQGAVSSVRPQPVRIDELADVPPKQDTIEVHALFTNANGFFGLTSYLAYADQQLKKSHEWISNAQRTDRSVYDFPWRRIDDANVEASGFLPKPFSFELDQERILDLLTGHTLYNDTGVVLRELVQNAMDAVRLQGLINPEQELEGRVTICWNSQERLLSVRDNGTGMTQSIVENHLLRVGSSRYQEPEFRKKYPSFSAISRFGIGVLSCFMIADDVEIITCHPEEEEARHLSLRSVHGKYLIRLLDKEGDSEAHALCPHGTEVRLRLRPSARIDNVLEIARRWIVLPGCKVRVKVDQSDTVDVGYASLSGALLETLMVLGYQAGPDSINRSLEDVLDARDGEIRIVERTDGPVTLAYAAQWSSYFQEWSLVDFPTSAQARFHRSGIRDIFVGTCVEGIRVEFGTPGFQGLQFAAIANASGPSAPKTNVARSGIEATAERSSMLRAIYAIYSGHIGNEIALLHEKRGFSLTWAAQEARWLINPLFIGRTLPQEPGILLEELAKLPLLLVEAEGNRRAVSVRQLHSTDTFWTSESALFYSAEGLIRESASQASLSAIVSALRCSRAQSSERHAPRIHRA